MSSIILYSNNRCRKLVQPGVHSREVQTYNPVRKPSATLYVLVYTIFMVFILTGCNSSTVTASIAPLATTPVSSTTETPVIPTTAVPPTATIEPLAARVNGAEITIAEYQAELALYQAAVNRDLTAEDEQIVLNDLIDRALLAQAATQAGFTLDRGQIDERIQTMVDQLGDQDAFSRWVNDFYPDERTFRNSLARAVAAAWMRDQIIAETPTSAEHVHAIQILLYTADEADEVLEQLVAGNDFRNLAVEYDPITAGDLGWFPRGYLPDQGLEQVAFELLPGEFSPIIETLAGYHIIQVLDRDPDRTLTPDAFRMLQAMTLIEWLDQERADSEIELLLP